MLTKLKRAISGIFLGDPVAETEEIYRTIDEDFRIYLGLFRKNRTEVVWLKFVNESLVMHSSYSVYGVAIAVDSFQSFAEFLASSQRAGLQGGTVHRRISLSIWISLMISEGVSKPSLLGEYRAASEPKIVTRLFSFRNERDQHRVLLEHKPSVDDNPYVVFDFEVLAIMQREIEDRQRRASGRTQYLPAP